MLRDCTPRALPRASRSGRHVGLRPPRNDKLGGLTPQNACRKDCQPARRSLSAATVKFDSDCVRRHSVYIGSAFPRLPRRFAPRNDTSGSAVVYQRPPTVELPCTGRSLRSRWRLCRLTDAACPLRVHTGFLHFSNLDLTKNLSPNLLAELRGAAIKAFLAEGFSSV